jgi:hypothetical protein
MADIPLLVISENTSSERRITPSWTISQLKSKLEPVTGVPPSAQEIFVKISTQEKVPITAADEETTQLTNFYLPAYAELHVSGSVLGSNLRYMASFPCCKSFFPLGGGVPEAISSSLHMVAGRMLF